MKRYFKLYKKILSVALMRAAAYPQDVVLWMVVDAIWAVIGIGFFRIILFVIPEIAGWNFEELSVPLGILYLLNTFIWGFIWPNLRELPTDINKGNLDMFLIKPANSQFLISTRYISINLIASFASGLFLLWYGFQHNHIPALGIAVVPFALVSTILTSYSLWFMSVTMTFWFNRLLNIGMLYPHALDIARYPVAIFNPLMRFVFTFIIPFALLGFLPAEVLLGKTSPILLILLPAVALSLLFLSHLFWNFSLKKYSSASS